MAVIFTIILIGVIVAALWPVASAAAAVAVGIGVLWGTIAAVINYFRAISDVLRNDNKEG